MNQEEQEVWQLEECYWDVLKNNDQEGYLKLWHDDFVGWPNWSDLPAGKDKIEGSFKAAHKNPNLTFDYELECMSVKKYDSVVIAIYQVKVCYIDKEKNMKSPMQSTNVIHTWQYNGNSWEIIGGMNTDLV